MKYNHYAIVFHPLTTKITFDQQIVLMNAVNYECILERHKDAPYEDLLQNVRETKLDLILMTEFEKISIIIEDDTYGTFTMFRFQSDILINDTIFIFYFGNLTLNSKDVENMQRINRFCEDLNLTITKFSPSKIITREKDIVRVSYSLANLPSDGKLALEDIFNRFTNSRFNIH